MTTDITELAQSLKRRAASANEFGESLYVKADNVLAVVEALEKAQRRITQLESRTVTVKQGEVLVTVAGFTGCGKSAIAGEIEIALKAIGVSVTWVNGDA